MSKQEKQFPLPLSSVVKQNNVKDSSKSYSDQRLGRVEMPQTAMKNATKHLPIPFISNKVDTKSSLVVQPSSLLVDQKLKSTPQIANGSDKVRQAMVARVTAQGVNDKLVLSALEAIPRHLFIESGLSSQAYIDASLPIGHHQTISKPYIVARMIEIMRNGKSLNNVLEIGTGCGYQAAVLSLVAKNVYSIERIKALHELAKNNLRPMRIGNIRLQYGDGMLGLPQVAPFDGIILAAAGLEVPQALLNQLSIGGRLIAPVGGVNQVLNLIERVSEYEWRNTVMENCHFVPLRQGVI